MERRLFSNMTETIKLTLDEIKSENVNFLTQLKIFACSIAMIPVAMVIFLSTAMLEMIQIPSQTIDMISMNEKSKLAIRRKLHADLCLK